MENTSTIYNDLNAAQKEAVLYGEGPLLILAGAGSGKTRVVTYRISHLIKDLQVMPQQIMALTFTNKAALEMKERVSKLIGSNVDRMWIGTFHSVMVKVLRQFGSLLHYSPSFQILDTEEQQKLIKTILQEQGLDKDMYDPRAVIQAISKQKGRLLTVEQFYEKYPTLTKCLDSTAKLCFPFYAEYQKRLLSLNAMDFDDLLLNAYVLFVNYPHVLELYANRFRYIFVDEYQDTNVAQYNLVHMLSSKHRNLCVVGDDDQSIYAFRGADVRIILSFEEDFPDAKVIKLEQNYRSSATILQAANNIIKHNRKRKAKELWTTAASGDKITYYRALNQQDEADYVVETIKKSVQQGQEYRKFAVLYRVNALSRNLELAFLKAQIPFHIFGGLRFYERKEIKDVLAYLRLICDPKDDLAFIRVVNTPKRQIGTSTVEKVLTLARTSGKSALEICAEVSRYPELQKAQNKLATFARLVADMRRNLQNPAFTLASYIEYVQNESGLVEEILNQMEKGREDSAQRVENLKEMLSDAVDFVKQAKFDTLDFTDEQLEENDLLAFVSRERKAITDLSTAPVKTYDGKAADLSLLEQEALKRTTESDSEAESLRQRTLLDDLHDYLEMTVLNQAVEGENDGNFVTLMTLHAAKGLEFDNVFIVGMEESIFPGVRSLNNIESLEEERRLAYVGVTRAKKKLTLTATAERLLYGSTTYNPQSRFVKEIPPELLDEKQNETSADNYDLFQHNDRRHYESSGSFSFGNYQANNYNSNKNTVAYSQRVINKGVQEAMSQLHKISNNKKTEIKLTPLAAGKSTNELELAQLKVNMRVVHARLGHGVIKQIEPVANDAIIVIQLDNGESKRIMAKAAHLQRE